MGWRLAASPVASSWAGAATMPAWPVRMVGKAAHGSVMVTMTFIGSAGSTEVPLMLAAAMPMRAEARRASMSFFRAAPSRGSPLVKVMPGRSSMVQVLKSALGVKALAR